MKKIAVLSLSGGMDSTCLLVHLLELGFEVHCISFDYGQKHKVELERAKQNILYLTDQKLPVQHQIVNLSSIMGLFESALTTPGVDVPEGHYEQENMKLTVVPNRNAIFSAIIYGYALSLGTKYNTSVNISLGIHSGDHAVYPDCRPEFIDAFANLARLATKAGVEGKPLKIETPLLHLSKANIIRLGIEHGVDYSQTVSCYQADAQGRACGKCDSCRLRQQGFIEAGITDPTRYTE